MSASHSAAAVQFETESTPNPDMSHSVNLLAVPDDSANAANTDPILLLNSYRRTVKMREADEEGLATMYLDEIGQYSVLTKEQEYALAQQMRAGREVEPKVVIDGLRRAFGMLPLFPAEEKRAALIHRGKTAKQTFLHHNLRLAASVAQKFKGQGMSYLDLVQEANLSLDHAIDKFDENKGFKFSTYATWWLHQGLSRAIDEKGRKIRLSVQREGDLRQLERERRLHVAEHGPDVPLTDQDLFEKLGWNETKQQNVKAAQRVTQVDSLNDEVNSSHDNTGGPTEREHFVSDPWAEDIIKSFDHSVVWADFFEIVSSTLSKEDLYILTASNSFGREKPASEKILAQELGITTGALRSHKNAALARLQHPVMLSRYAGLAELFVEDGDDRFEWLARVACSGIAVDDFFTSRGGQVSDRAKAACESCPVIEECGAHAKKVKAQIGYWAGKSGRDRTRKKKQDK